MPSSGELLGARYRLDDRIAAGGMGEVWRATDTVLERPVAVKTLLAGYAGDSGFRTRFHHEARAMAALRHAGVAPVYDFGDTGEGAYLVMARVDGMPLDRWIAEHGPLTADETMSVVAQAARALGAAHDAGIVHRDVKPGNLILEPDGHVVLVDFGVARSASSVTLTGAKEVVGTALYIAPEQVSKRATGPAADLYALGVVAYHCLSGNPPFLGDNPLAVALQHVKDAPPPLPAEVPAPVRDLVTTALAKEPEQRFPSAFAMAEAADRARATIAGGAATGTGLAATAAMAAVADLPETGTAAGDLAETRVAGQPFIGSARATTPPPNPAFVSTGHLQAQAPPLDATRPHSPAVPLTAPPPPPPGAPAVTGAGDPARRRRTAVVLGALLATLLGVGAVLAFVDPFGYFDEETPSTPPPANIAPKSSPQAPKKDNPQQGDTRTDSDRTNEEQSTGRPQDDQPENTAPAPTSTTTTGTATTAPAEPEPTTTTGAPEEEETEPTTPDNSAGAEADTEAESGATG